MGRIHISDPMFYLTVIVRIQSNNPIEFNFGMVEPFLVYLVGSHISVVHTKFDGYPRFLTEICQY